MKYELRHIHGRGRRSHPARGAWIEIVNSHRMGVPLVVAPRKGCVD